jgi:hypothetical protein
MDNEFEIAYQTDSKIAYKLHSIECVTGEFIKALVWPPGIRGLIFLFEEQIIDEHVILSALPLEFDVGMVYSATKTSLPNGYSSGAGIFCEVPVPGEEELLKLYLLGREMVLAPILSTRKVSPVDISVVQLKIREQLAKGKIGLWTKGGTSAGAVALTRWHDFADTPVQWIPWVWINSALLPEERRDLHGLISIWIKSNVENKVQCVVDSYNVRSQKFFKKMGFVPECLHIIRP